MTKIYKGKDAKIYINDLEIGCASEVTLRITEDLEPYYGIENPIPDRLVPGSKQIEGTLSRVLVNTYYLNLLGINEEGFAWNNSVTFDLKFKTQAKALYLYDCRFTKSRIDISQNAFLSESYDFIAKSLTVEEEEEEENGTPYELYLPPDFRN